MSQFAGQEMAGQGAVSDAERMAAAGVMGGMVPQKPSVMGAMKGAMQGGVMGGMGQAAPTQGGMGQSAPMGPAGADTDTIMEGLRQLGKYAQGGCV
jgi:hypothetical protein